MEFKWLVVDTLLMTAFGLKHTLFTTKTAVNLFNRVFPPQLWNVVYSCISITLLILISRLWESSGITIYRLSGIAYYSVYGLMAFFLFMFFYCFKYTTSFWQWLGLEQLWKTITGKPMPEYYRVRKHGLKRYIRFPHHTFLALIFWCQPVMTVDTLWMAIFATAYTYIGTVHQDSRGRRLLGEEWIEYSKHTNLLIPDISMVWRDVFEKPVMLITSSEQEALEK